MCKLFVDFQNLLSSPSPDYKAFCHLIKERQKTLLGLDLVRSYGLFRLAQALQHWYESREGHADIAVLIRQVIRSYKQRLIIPNEFWRAISKDEYTSGLRPIDISEMNVLQITADAWHPNWLKGTDDIDRLELRRNNAPVVGDGLLYAMTGGIFTRYQSLAQRVAVQACFFMPPGSTLLMALPTGAGKSLTIYLSAWHASAGGTIKGGTTIVVVPTVSLALDQEQKARRFFFRAPAPEYEVYSWTSGTSMETRAIIQEGILYGSLPLLYVSPEALIKSDLYDTCLEAASRGTLNYFIIDEAHLIETWGAGFRPEFQLLAAYRKQLLTRSRGKLRTLLLSATISRTCAQLLKTLFGHDVPYHTIRANRLRSEPSYWFRFSQSVLRREKRVLEALYHLPRPLILYVTTPDAAIHWEQLLRQEGFLRCASFTGETDANSRQELLDKWNNDEIDIMVATSAFSVGIDKQNVRTIIHACLPENMDRFYQEVGRAGRDGYSAISLVCTTIKDNEMAFSMTRASRITAEQAAKRWEGMRKASNRSDSGQNDLLLVDTNVPPEDKPDMRRSEANREWNEHTLLLMQRTRLIQITDTRDDVARVDANISAGNSREAKNIDRLQVRLRNTSITGYPDTPAFLQTLEEVRNREIHEIRKALRNMERLVEMYKQENAKECLAFQLANLYPGCARSCGGCPHCRSLQLQPYEHTLPLDIDVETDSASSAYLDGELRSFMGWHSILNVMWDGVGHLLTQKHLILVLARLVSAGIQQLILPSELLSNESWVNNLIRQIAQSISSFLVPHQILSIDEIMKYPQIPVYAIPTVLVYPGDSDKANELHRFMHNRLQKWYRQHIPLVNIVPQALVLESEQGRFLDRIDGITEEIGHLHELLTRWQEFIFY